jgi:hypothetical protein
VVSDAFKEKKKKEKGKKKVYSIIHVTLNFSFNFWNKVLPYVIGTKTYAGTN